MDQVEANSHPSGFVPMIMHTDGNGIRTMVVDNLCDSDAADAKGLASHTEWLLRQTEDDGGDYIYGGKVEWCLNTDPATGEKWLKVQFDPQAFFGRGVVSSNEAL